MADFNDRFWAMIGESRADAHSLSDQMQALSDLLEGLEPDALMEFQRWLEDRVSDAYRWDLWAVAFIVNGGCSDDGFYYFEGWLIAQGREYYESALAAPERAADRIEPGEYAECEEIFLIAPRMYQAKTGRDYFDDCPAEAPRTIQGTPWDEDSVEDLFPDLAEKFS